MSPEDTQVVDIHFAFNNKKLLKLLARRAKALEKSKFDKKRKIE